MFYLLISFLPDLLAYLLPVGVAVAGGLRWRRASASARRSMAWVSLAVGLFGVADYLLLWALPRLGLSFGPLEVPLVFLLLARSFLLVGWMYLGDGRLLRPAWRAGMLLFQVALTLGLLYAFYYEPFDLKVTRLEMKTPDLQPGGRLRIVQLADTHVERTSPREREVVELVRSLEPDLIVLTGDYISNSYSFDPQAEADFRWMIGQLRAGTGIYAVNGSTERPARARELFDGLGVTLLDNERITVATPAGEVVLVGISNLVHIPDARALAQVAGPVPAESYSILLYHTPDLVETAADMGMDLYLASHTHGGQICLPFYGAVVTFSLYGKQYEQGLFQRDAMWMYVSRGLGMEGKKAPRARFLAPPELVVVDLVGEGR